MLFVKIWFLGFGALQLGAKLWFKFWIKEASTLRAH